MSGGVRSAEIPEPALFPLQHTQCAVSVPEPALFLLQHIQCALSVFKVTVWLLQLQLARLHPSQEEGTSRG